MSDFRDLIDLAVDRLGGAVLWATDDFFAPKEALLKKEAPIFLEHEYTDKGKWMDGWESRRKRTPGHDYALIRLGLPGVIRGLVVDTAFFRGNYPESCSALACSAPADATPEELDGPGTEWVEILPRTALQGNHQHLFPVDSPHRFTHLRFRIFPDGGVARLRVHGEVVPDWKRVGRGGAELDVAASENGARVPACSDMFFGVRHNLIAPGRAPNMGDGWETKRRRGPGFDWALVELSGEAVLSRIEIDTNHFKGNYPDTAMLEGINAPGATVEELQSHPGWMEILSRRKLQASTRHLYHDEEIAHHGPFTHVRLNIYPDGGVSRLRIQGSLTREAGIALRVKRLDTLLKSEAEAELLSCCGSRAWAAQMAAKRPFGSMERVLEAADQVWRGLSEEDWREAFLAHPRIGEKKAQSEQDARAKAWSSKEQSGISAASAEALAALAEGNRAYDARFGRIYIVCATGRSAEEMLANLKARLGNDEATEIRISAEEQRQITRIRLEKSFV